MPTSTDILGGMSVSGPLQNLVDFFLHLGTDFFAFLVVAAVIFGLSFYFGRDRLIALAAALYAAVVLYQAFPYASFIPQNTPLLQIGLFLVFVVAGWVAFSGMSYFLAQHDGGGLGTMVISLALAGAFLAVGMHVLPVQDLYTFSEPTKALFSSNESFFLWLLAPLGALFFFGR